MTNLLSVSLLKDATILGHGTGEFLRVFWHFSGTERPSLDVSDQRKCGKATSSASSLHSLYYLTRFAQSSFIKHMA